MSETSQENKGEFDICEVCQKPVKSSRRGSMTAWIFSSGYCTCEVLAATPKINKQARSRDLKRTAEQAAIDQSFIDENGFPMLGNRFKITDPIGIGGMGEIYKVRETNQNEPLAIKILRDEFASDETSVKRLKKEALTASSLSHPNIIQVMGYSSTPDGKPFLVMEYVDGVSLEHLIKIEGKLDWRRVINLVVQICEGLTYAHNRGVIHRDLKPSNILITKSKTGMEHAKILDLGISKQISGGEQELQENTKLTQTGDVIGSPLYMSPEQCQGESVDSRSDVYSLGCLTYEALTGQAPFAAENAVKVILNHITMERGKLSQELELLGIPDSLKKIIVEKCLAVDPAQRFGSVVELSKGLWSIANQTNTEIYRAAKSTKLTKKAVMISSFFGLILIIGASLYGAVLLKEKNSQPAIRVSAVASDPSPESNKKSFDEMSMLVNEKNKQIEELASKVDIEKDKKETGSEKEKSASKEVASQSVAKIKNIVSKPVIVGAAKSKRPNSSPERKKSPRQTSPSGSSRVTAGSRNLQASRAAAQYNTRTSSSGLSARQLRKLRAFKNTIPRSWLRINFSSLDRDRNGYISQSELGYYWSWAAKYDTDLNQYLSKQEVSRKMPGNDKRRMNLPKLWVRANFNTLDKNRDGYISKGEVRFLWRWLRKYDANRDMNISYPETMPKYHP